ncbi:MAG: ATP-binding protein [Chitinophagales bacterium]
MLKCCTTIGIICLCLSINGFGANTYGANQTKSFYAGWQFPFQGNYSTNHYKTIEDHIDLADKLITENKHEKALYNYELAAKQALASNDSISWLSILYKIGNTQNELNLFKNAVESLYLYRDAGTGKVEEKLRSQALSTIGAIYQHLGIYQLAFSYQLEALALRTKSKDTLGMTQSYYELGHVFFHQDNFVNALYYYEKARKFCAQSSNQDFMYSYLGAIGRCYEKKGKAQKALSFNLQSLEMAKKTGDEEKIAYAAHSVGANYAGLYNFEKALAYLEQSLKLNRKAANKRDQPETLSVMAEVFREQGDYEKAKLVLNEAMQISHEINAKPRIIDLYRSLAQLYECAENWKLAAHYWQDYAISAKELQNESTTQKIAEAQESYEVRKQKDSLEELRAKQKIQSIYRYVFGIGFLFLLLLLWLLYSRYKIQAANAYLLEEKNRQINLQNQQLASANLIQSETNRLLEGKNHQINLQNQKLESSNKDLEQFAYIASHDLKEPLRTIGSYTSLIKRRYHHSFDEDAEEFMDFIVDAVHRMNNLLNDLLSYSRVGRKQSFEVIDTQRLTKLVLANLHQQIKQRKAVVSIIGEFPKISANAYQMQQLFQNLISNAIKFNNTETPEIILSYKPNQKHFIFTIKDNGIGIAPEYQDKIFEMFRRLHTRNEYDGTGIGLATCKKIVEQHNGRIWVESIINEGSTFHIALPKEPLPQFVPAIAPASDHAY